MFLNSRCLKMSPEKPSSCTIVLICSLSIFFVSLRVVSPLEIRSCCPVGYVLVDINQGFFAAPEKYECLSAWNVSRSGRKLETFETAAIHGFQIKETNISSVPQCDKQILVKFTEEVDLPPRSCIVKLYGSIYAISCPYDDDFIYKVTMMRKCCPFNYVYESALQKCIQKNVPLNYYEVFFNHPVVLNDSLLKCKPGQAVVEYKLRYNDFKFIDGYLLMKLTNQRFSIDEFCVEGVVNSKEVIDKSSVQGFKNSLRFLVRVCNRDSICERIPCIRKCCEIGEMYARVNGSSQCISDPNDIGYQSFESFDFTGHFDKPSVFGVVRGLNCKKYRLNPGPDSTEDENIISDDDGSIYMPFIRKRLDNINYCVEKIHNGVNATKKFYSFVCFDDLGRDDLKFSLYSVGCLISCVFYALTLLVYLSISKLRNLPGKILICLVISLFTAYMGIAITQITPPADNVCFVCAFGIYFSLIAAFAWTNVMCFDIWQTFGSAERSCSIKQNQGRKFIFYSLYGWGLPLLLTSTLICLTKFKLLSDHLRPKFGQGRCWFERTLAKSQLMFFTGPVGVLFIINFILFTITLRYCNKVKREIFRMQSSNMEKPVLRKRFFMDKARFMMNTKLFMVMGITWLLELISIIFYDRRRTFFWVLSDAFNILLGVIVFFIFVFKKRVWQAILLRLGIKTADSLRNGPATFTSYATCGASNLNLDRIRSAESHSSLLSPASAATRRLS